MVKRIRTAGGLKISKNLPSKQASFHMLSTGNVSAVAWGLKN
jgi:hypothetical protein